MISCIIVDDEPLAQNILEKYISRVPTLQLVKKLDNAIDTISFLYEHNIDLIFLDINMPELSGLEMLKTLEDPPKVILTTAYSEYGVESYEYKIIDYLLKPIPFERFIKAVNRVMEIEKNNIIQTRKDETSSDHIFLKEDHINHKVSYDDIFYIQAYGNYLKFFTTQKQIVIRKTITECENLLPDKCFVRIHKSYIISISKVKAINGNRVLLTNEVLIPIGNVYKLNFEKRVKK